MKKLYNNGQMRVAGFMSGSGSVLTEIIEKELGYKVVVIFSDRKSSAQLIGEKYKIPVLEKNINEFYQERNIPRSNLVVREEFDLDVIELIKPFEIDVIAYAGYMSIVTKPLYSRYLGINVHPADLTIKENGKRKYIGAHAVKDAIENGEKYLRSTTHIVEKEVDGGKILIRSVPILVDFNKSYKENQENLKIKADNIIFPKTLEYISQGRFEINNNGELFFDQKKIPLGVVLNE